MLAMSITSGLPSHRTPGGHTGQIRVVSGADLFDHLVGEGKDAVRNIEAEGLGSLEVDHQFEFGWLHYREVSRPFALEDTGGIIAHLPVAVADIVTVAHQATSLGELASCVNRGYAITGGV